MKKMHLQTLSDAAPRLTVIESVLDSMLAMPDFEDITVRHARLFLLIYGKPNQVFTVRSLAEAMAIPKPSVTRGMDRLSLSGLLMREPDPSGDKRSIVARPTGKGVLLYARLAKAVP